MARRKIAVIGIGKISQDQHLPVIDKSKHFQLAATVSQRGVGHGGVPVFKTAAELYRAMPDVDLVAICTPPSVRHTLVREALDAGKHVLMEKPPTPTISEFDDLVAHAKKRKRVLFQTWHSQYNEAVEKTRKILKREGVASVSIDWRENVRKWHPGQDWLWEPGGFGMFDPGINALSIFTRIMPFPVFVKSAVLKVPTNRQTPIDVAIVFKAGDEGGPDMKAHFNGLQEDGEIWNITIKTAKGRTLLLEKGGAVLNIDGQGGPANLFEEYERIYERFAKLLKTGKSHADGAPLRLVADAFLLGSRENADPFEW